MKRYEIYLALLSAFKEVKINGIKKLTINKIVGHTILNNFNKINDFVEIGISFDMFTNSGHKFKNYLLKLHNFVQGKSIDYNILYEDQICSINENKIAKQNSSLLKLPSEIISMIMYYVKINMINDYLENLTLSKDLTLSKQPFASIQDEENKLIGEQYLQ